MSLSSSTIETLSLIQKQSAPYICYIELFLGVINCSINIALFSRPRLRATSICIYFLGASVAQLSTLTFGLVSDIYATNYGDFGLKSVIFCKFRNYFQQWAYMTSRWCLVAACLDRLALSSYNMRWQNLATTYVAYRVVVVITVVWFILPTPILFYYDIRGSICGSVYNLATQYYHPSFTLLTGFVLPTFFMITSAFLIYRNLVQKRRRRHILTVQQEEVRNVTEEKQRKRDRQVLFVLLVQSIAYLTTSAPWFIFLFYNTATISIKNKSAERLAIERFIYFLVQPIQYLFPICSFYLYTLTSCVFRAELKIMISFLLRSIHLLNNHRIEPISNLTGNQIMAERRIRLTTVSKHRNPGEQVVTQTNKIIPKEKNELDCTI